MAADDHAIVVGITRYPSFEELRGPENDALAMEEWLKDPAGGDVPKKQIETIVSSCFDKGDVKPTTEQVYEAFERLIDLGEARDPKPAGRRLYVFLAGHGFGPDLREAAVLMANAAPRRMGHCINGGKVADHFARAAYFREVVLLMDCCRDDLGLNVETALPWQPKLGSGAGKVKWFYGYAAGFPRQARERELDGGVVRGVFTAALLDGLRSGIHDVERLRNFVTARMVELADRDNVQTPVIQSNADAMAFGPLVARPTLAIDLAPGADTATVAVGRGDQAPPFATQSVKRGTPWRLELDPGLYEVVRQDTGASRIAQLTAGVHDVEI